MEKNDFRAEELEIKYIGKILSELDQSIAVPVSISAESLMLKLDGVKAEKKTPVLSFDFFRSRVFSPQSALSYALALVVIVVVAYTFENSRESIISGDMMLENAAPSSISEAAAQSPDAGSPLQSPRMAEPAQAAEAFSMDSDTESAENAQLFDSPMQVTAGVGGSGRSTVLYESSEFNIICRSNDETDPDKAGIPVSLEIINNNAGGVLTSIDFGDILNIEKLYVSGDTIAVIGSNVAESIVYAYDISAVQFGGEALFVSSLKQPGAYAASTFYDDVLYNVTIAEEAGNAQVNSLPGAVSEDICIVSAFNRAGEAKSYAYTGYSREVSVHERSIYITYDSKTEEGKNQISMARLLLDGLNIDLDII